MIDESDNESINKSIDESDNESINESINESDNESDNELIENINKESKKEFIEDLKKAIDISNKSTTSWYDKNKFNKILTTIGKSNSNHKKSRQIKI